MFDKLPPAAQWGGLAGLLILGAVAIFLKTRSDDAVLPDTGVIFEGEVIYDGNPLSYAVVTLYPDNAPPLEGEIFSRGNLERDGSVRIESAPRGRVRITINTAEIRGQLMGQFVAAAQQATSNGKKFETPKIIDVPSVYFSPETSGIVKTLEKGVNKVKIELSSKGPEVTSKQ